MQLLLAQVILKKYKDPHIYTAVIKYPTPITSAFQILYYPPSLSDEKISGTTWESYLTHSSVQPMQGV